MTGMHGPTPPQSGSGAWQGQRNLTTMGVGLLLLALLLLATACGEPGETAGQMLSGGTLEVADGDAWKPTEVGESVAIGARIRTGSREARLGLRAGEIWLAPMSMAVIGRDEVDVVRGEVLVNSEGALSARWSDMTVGGEAVYRLVPGISPVLKVYEGSAQVRRPAEDRTVPALRQLGLGAPRLPGDPAPLAYDSGDDWDRQLLAGAVAFDAEAETIARGLAAQHGSLPQDAAWYGSFTSEDAKAIPVLADTSPSRTDDDRFGSPSDTLMTLFIAEAAVARHGGDLATLTRAIADLRRAGARWGGVALEHGVSMAEVAQVVDRALDRHLAEVPVAAADAGDADPVEGSEGVTPVDSVELTVGEPGTEDGTALAGTDAAGADTHGATAGTVAPSTAGAQGGQGGQGGAVVPRVAGPPGGGATGSPAAGSPAPSGGGSASGTGGTTGGSPPATAPGGATSPPVATAPAPRPAPKPAPSPTSSPSPSPAPDATGGEMGDEFGAINELVEDVVGFRGDVSDR